MQACNVRRIGHYVRWSSGHRDEDRDHEGDRDEEQGTSGTWPPARELGERSGEKIAHAPHQRCPNHRKKSPIALKMNTEIRGRPMAARKL